MERTAYFASGCFWCITPVLEGTEGVLSVRAGYSGGTEENPTYEDVKHQKTGHRETVAVAYDDSVVPFGTLVDLFLAHVDPFDGGGQFIDRGHSYTLAVYCTTEEERRTVEEKLHAVEAEAGMETHVAVEEFVSFFEAEEYHQDWWRKNPEGYGRELQESGRSERWKNTIPILELGK